VVKEELRIRKEVVEEAEVVEEEVRREEIEVDDQTEHRDV
jgi:stress response protein YsnF